MDDIEVLALDLEGTLISNAVSQIPRPGLHEFLSFCLDTFPRVVFYTAVRRGKVYSILGRLASRNAIPEAARSLECVRWEGRRKDLRDVPGTEASKVWIIDDQKGYIRPDQRDQWIQIQEFSPPYSDEDRKLLELRERLEKRLSP